MIFVNIKSETSAEFLLNLDFVFFITKEKRYTENPRFNYVEIPNEFNYFVQLKNGGKIKISSEEYEKIKKYVLNGGNK